MTLTEKKAARAKAEANREEILATFRKADIECIKAQSRRIELLEKELAEAKERLSHWDMNALEEREKREGNLRTEITELKAKLKILQNPSDGRCMEISNLRAEVSRLKSTPPAARVEGLLEALRYYADQHTWEGSKESIIGIYNVIDHRDVVNFDHRGFKCGGRFARMALKNYESQDEVK